MNKYKPLYIWFLKINLLIKNGSIYWCDNRYQPMKLILPNEKLEKLLLKYAINKNE